MEDFIVVEVTKEDLSHNYGNNQGCPLYQALQRTGYPVKHVSGRIVYLGEVDSPAYKGPEIEYGIVEWSELCGIAMGPEAEKEPLLVHLLKITQEG